MDGIVPVELAARIRLELTTEDVMSRTIKTLIDDTIDDELPIMEPSMMDMSGETFDLLHECMDVMHEFDVLDHAFTMRLFLAQSEAVDREIADMLAAPR